MNMCDFKGTCVSYREWKDETSSGALRVHALIRRRKRRVVLEFSRRRRSEGRSICGWEGGVSSRPLRAPLHTQRAGR